MRRQAVLLTLLIGACGSEDPSRTGTSDGVTTVTTVGEHDDAAASTMTAADMGDTAGVACRAASEACSSFGPDCCPGLACDRCGDESVGSCVPERDAQCLGTTGTAGGGEGTTTTADDTGDRCIPKEGFCARSQDCCPGLQCEVVEVGICL